MNIKSYKYPTTGLNDFIENTLCKCPVCKHELAYYMDTFVCPVCDKIPLADLVWCKDYMRQQKEEEEKKRT